MTREALRALLAAGTPGPWSKPFDDGALTANGVDSLLGLDVDGMAIVDRPEDAALIAAAVNALPSLLDADARAEKAERERDALRAWVREALPWVRAALASGVRSGMDMDGARLDTEGRALLGEEG